jgi:Amt family ammonium transporter
MTRTIWPVVLALLAALILLLYVSLAWVEEAGSANALLTLALALLFPTGLTLLAWSAWPAERADKVATLAPLALVLALVGYLAVGFGLHFGGVAFVSDDEGLAELARFFSLARGDEGANWGFFGLEGFFLSGDTATRAALQLFVSQLPLVMSVVLIVMLALPRRTPPLAQLLAGLVASAVTYPLAGHWVSGGGWLAHLGQTLNLGHGLVDYLGAGAVFVCSGATALAAALVFGSRQEQPAPDGLPPARFPLLAGLGALLAAVGWIALGPLNPLYAQTGEMFNWPLVALNGLAGLAGGALTAQLYSWAATGRFDPLLGARGALAGLAALSAGAPFVPTWAALLVGAVAGLLLPLAVYSANRWLRLDDVSVAIATYGLSGLWGLLAVGLLADGRWGQGWNGVAGLPEQGVSGLLVASGLQADAGQLGAQFWGGLALFAWGFLLPWGLFKLLAWFSGLVSFLRERLFQDTAQS